MFSSKEAQASFELSLYLSSKEAQIYFEPNFYLHKYPSNLVPVILLIHTTKEDGTECSETSAHKIQTSRNHTKEIIQHFNRTKFEIEHLMRCFRENNIP